MTPATDEEPGILGVAEEFHEKPGSLPGEVITGRAALNLHGEDVRPNNDVIRLIDIRLSEGQ